MGIGSDRREETVPRLAILVRIDLHEPQVDELDQGIEDRGESPVGLVQHGSQALAGAPTREDRHVAQDGLLGIARDRVAGSEGRSDLPVAVRSRVRSWRAQVEHRVFLEGRELRHGDMVRARAAPSSMARGRPSKRRVRSATATALLSSSAKSGSSAAARAT